MNKTFAEKLKQIKKESGLTQQEVADLMQISKRAVEEWERGKSQPPAYAQQYLLDELKSRMKGSTNEWEFIEEPNTVDTLGRKVYYARCSNCGFVWTDLYAVKKYFKFCPHCGADMRKEGEGCHT